MVINKMQELAICSEGQELCLVKEVQELSVFKEGHELSVFREGHEPFMWRKVAGIVFQEGQKFPGNVRNFQIINRFFRSSRKVNDYPEIFQIFPNFPGHLQLTRSFNNVQICSYFVLDSLKIVHGNMKRF